ncbi:MAG TPA: hypothetical protein VNQ52_03200 [Microbacteriaceae bacterium]|nr:hypothetical protein [Microbacteriaceae bacterium]
MRTTRALGALAAVLLAGAMIAGCAPAAPQSLGLGGSDGETVDSGYETNGDDGLAEFWIEPIGFPNGTKLTFERRGANCVRNEVAGSTTLPAPDIFAMTMFTASFACGPVGGESSWATWNLTATLPGGATKTAVFEIQIPTKNLKNGFIAFNWSCWGGGSLSCKGGDLTSNSPSHRWNVHLPVTYQP